MGEAAIGRPRRRWCGHARMLFRLLLLFTVVPLVELALLIKVGQHIGAGATIGLVLLTGLGGAALARHEGWRTWIALQRDLAAGRLPGDRIVDALLILVAGILLITPGVLTDVVGLVLLLPLTRGQIRRYLKRRFMARMVIMGQGPFRPTESDRPSNRDDDFIDVEAQPPGDRSD